MRLYTYLNTHTTQAHRIHGITVKSENIATEYKEYNNTQNVQQ